MQVYRLHDQVFGDGNRSYEDKVLYGKGFLSCNKQQTRTGVA